MTTTVLMLDGGTFTLGGTDYSDAVSKIVLHASADTVEVPQTFATPKTLRKGPVKYELEIDYLSNDIASQLFDDLFAAIAVGQTGQLAFVVRFRAGAVSASNPQWTGTLVVTDASIGGEAGGLSNGSGTFGCTAAPVKATS